ncbi:PREDICTED: protein claret segregational [Ceratosolen solmsi marchali]|uniref:Protein claret segregational n=1 Tax=Ceratosolen solmsi marchali TaxID=326594 RepID=A0AAJ6YPW6_9HYME|nr:PREDICTED: protein claret segregational [Ceratosolen solmsi marchali]
MESRLPKLNFQFKVPAKTITGGTINNSLKSNVASNSNNASNIIKNSETKLATKTLSTLNVAANAADENKAPLTRSKTMASITRTNLTKAPLKRPGIANNVEPKRANLKTTMKSVIRPVRPATIVGTVAKARAITSTTTKPAGPKPCKWDLKGRLEYTNNELTTLKQKHREVSTEYNNIQSEIINLRESESTNRLKAENLEAESNKLIKEVETLKIEIDKLQTEKNSLVKELKESKDLYNKVSVSLEQYKDDLCVKAVLITDQENEIMQLKNKLEIQEKSSTNRISELETLNEDLGALVQNMDKERRVLHNAIQELKGNIRVFCRVRPKLSKEAIKNTCAINYLDECTLEVGKADGDVANINNIKLKGQRQEFTFDKVFPPNTSQADVFAELSMLVQSALEGYNVCVFAYGQTGSGKTYTMEGFPGTDDEGMIPRTVKHIFKEMKQFELLGWEYKIEASFLEIYNEQIVDLLDYTRKTHEIRMTDSKGSDLYVSNLLVQEINSPEELQQCLLIAQQNRAMAATQSNERSSRSHSVARIRLIGTHKNKQEISIGNLNLVDLAGSERLKNEEAARVAETKNINKSLANLGHVILALLQKQDHIPYRNSKLTHLLMLSLGGNSKTLMLLNISPLEESYNETLNSLRFGSNVNSCKTGTIKKIRTVL